MALLLRCAALLALIYAASAQFECAYPQSANVESYSVSNACTIDYAQYTAEPVPFDVIRSEYMRRCPSVLNATTKVYRVGGLGIRGAITFYDQYRDTFETWLNEKLACSEGLLFRVEDTPFNVQDQLTAEGSIDLVYTNPSAFSCFMASYGVRPIMSQVNYRTVNGISYELEYFGGTIFVRADSNITKVEEIKGKRVSAVKISGLGAMQLQWQHLENLGIYLFQEAKMVMFSQNQRRIVYDVLNGRADMGFVRTDQIEGMAGAALSDGTIFRPDLLRILEPKTSHPEYAGTGASFPFNSTTSLTPEWPVGMQPSMDPDAAFKLMEALAMIQPMDDAAVKGQYVKWRPALDYMSLVKLNLNLGIMNITTGQCSDAGDVYTPVKCAPGYFKKPLEQVDTLCQLLNIAGKAKGNMDDCFDLFYNATDGDDALARATERAEAAGYVADDQTILESRKYQCVCDPCSLIPEQQLKIAPVSVTRSGVTLMGGSAMHEVGFEDAQGSGGGCERLESCFTIVSGDEVEIKITDALGVTGRQAVGLPLVSRIELGVLSSDELQEAEPEVNANNITVAWTIRARFTDVGDTLVQVLADGENAEASPFRIRVDPAPQPDSIGAWQIALIVIAAVVLAMLLFIVIVLYFRQSNIAFTLEEHYARIATQLLGDIEFIKVLGEGSFGKVYHAVWQGSHVAVKVIEHVNAAIIEMAEREARLTTELAHPNIVMTLHYAVRSADGTSITSDDMQNARGGGHTQVSMLMRAVMHSRKSSRHEKSSHGSVGTFRSASSFFGRRSKTRTSTNDKSTGSVTASSLAPNNRAHVQGLIKDAEAQAEGVEKDNESTDMQVPMGPEESGPIQPYRPSTTVHSCDAYESENVDEARGAADNNAGAKVSGVPSVRIALPAADSSGKAEPRKDGGSDEDEEEAFDVHDKGGAATWGTFSPATDIATNQTRGSAADGDQQTGPSVQTWIILEYCDKGSLSAVMKTKAFRNDTEPKMDVVLRTVLDVARGMQYLHEKGIVHSDLKTGNVLLQSRGEDPRGFRAKVADFGLSRSLGDSGATINTNTYGTITHMPPELLKSGRLTEAADVYSFGMLMWEVYTGSHPFRKATHAEIVTKVIVMGERPEWPPGCSKLYSNIASKCWSAVEKERPSFEMIVAQLDGLLGSIGDL